MHVHQSVFDRNAKRNLFSQPDGEPSQEFYWFIGGQQKFLGPAMPLLAPNINSYRRLRRWSTAPINVHWGIENRTVGLRVPISSPEARRVENRIAGADANPYLAMAASLACGWLGITREIEPSDPIKGTAYRLAQSLPQQMPEALAQAEAERAAQGVLGEHFVEVLLAVKQTEHDAYQRVISSWEREHLFRQRVRAVRIGRIDRSGAPRHGRR